MEGQEGRSLLVSFWGRSVQWGHYYFQSDEGWHPRTYWWHLHSWGYGAPAYVLALPKEEGPMVDPSGSHLGILLLGLREEI